MLTKMSLLHEHHDSFEKVGSRSLLKLHRYLLKQIPTQVDTQGYSST